MTHVNDGAVNERPDCLERYTTFVNGLDISCQVLGIKEMICIEVQKVFSGLVNVEHKLIDHLGDCRLTMTISHGKVKMICRGFETCTEKAECLYGLKLGVRCCSEDWWYV